MNQLAAKLFEQNKYPFYGLILTYHFFERFIERFGCDVEVLDGLTKRINDEICLIMFDAAKVDRNHQQYILKHNGATIPLVLVRTSDSWCLKATTIY